MECIYKFIYLIWFSPVGAMLYTTAVEIWNRSLFPTSVCWFLAKWTSFKQYVIVYNGLASQSLNLIKWHIPQMPFGHHSLLKNLVIIVKHELLISG